MNRMSSHTSPGPSADEDTDGDHQQWDVAESTTLADSKTASPADTANTPTTGNASKPQGSMQKRRRVTRACDECRRKKIKCDGKQPCTHCTVYSYECTYDQPSNRRRNPAPQYIEALENRLQKAEAILRSLLPSLDLDDPKYDARSVEQVVESSKAKHSAAKDDQVQKPEDDARIQAMIEQTGSYFSELLSVLSFDYPVNYYYVIELPAQCQSGFIPVYTLTLGSLDIDPDGYLDFHGHSSGFAFMRKLRSQYGDAFGYNYQLPATARYPLNQSLESPRSANSSPYEFQIPPAYDLPTKEVAIDLSRNTLDDACALMRFVHRPTFFKKLHKFYNTDPDHHDTADNRFLPLLYVVLAIGCLFAKTENENTVLDVGGYKEAIERGYQYFNASRQMIDITDCRDLQTLQTIVFMIVFLQSTAKLATCYAYIGVALRSCCRLGMHRNIEAPKQNVIEREERRRVFWLVRKMDCYVGTMLGLPQMLSEDDIDQQFPTEVADECIFEDGIRTSPADKFPLLKATNAHTRLTTILRKVIRYVYPVKGGTSPSDARYTISHARIREIERDLQQWMDALPMELRPSDNAGDETSRVQQLLRMSYAHVQMMLYRPFIHYVCGAGESKVTNIDKRSFACAAACVSVSRNIVHITSEMKRRGLLVGSYWFVMYTTYFAILSLVFFVLNNPDNPTTQEVLKDAMEGRDTLAGLAKRSFAADRCTHSLAKLFAELPEKIQERRSSLQVPASTSRKRRQPSSDDICMQANSTAAAVGLAPGNEEFQSPSRAMTFPHGLLGAANKRNSMPNSMVNSAYNLSDSNLPPQVSMGFGTPPGTASAPSLAPFTQHLGDPNIPDLRAVMFPSDNPFAYPNQPMSTLEATQYMSPEDQQDGFSAGTSEHDFHISNSIHAQMPADLSFNDLNNSVYTNNLAQQYHNNRHFSAPMGATNYPVSSVEDTLGMAGLANPQDEYWAQMNKQGIRTGVTPGAVNLDDLFGGDGWTGAWNEQSFPKP